MRGSLVEVRLAAANAQPSAPAAASGADARGENGGEEEEAADADAGSWRRAEVRRVELGLGGSFQVVVHTADGEPDEASVKWCSAWTENAEWRRTARAGSLRRGRAAVAAC